MASVPIESEARVERPLVSGTSILLFSAFLAGMVFGQALPWAAQVHATTAAAAGTIAYIGLWYTNRVREQRVNQQASQKIAQRLEKKLGKHLSTRKGLLAGMTRRVDGRGGY